jgi:tetratricopeptide (TPR) repeat protein
MNRRTTASLYDARHGLEHSLAIDPDYARAYAMLSWTHFDSYAEPFDCDHLNPAVRNRALELAQTAVRLDPRLLQAQLRIVLCHKRRHDAAIAAFQRALALNPDFINHRFAYASTFAGEDNAPSKVIGADLSLDPFPPLLFSLGAMGRRQLHAQALREARRCFRECISCLPDLRSPYVCLAST